MAKFILNVDMVWPIGSIYETTSTVHPNISLGGTWELYGIGQVTVCYDSTQTEFNTIGQTGGSKYLQNHRHATPGYARNIYFAYGGDSAWISSESFEDTGFLSYVSEPSDASTGNSMTTGDSGNLQPYIVVYRYRRTA